MEPDLSMIRESRLYPPVERHLKGAFLVKGEVQIGSKVLDIFAVSRSGRECLAIELKVNDWKRALKQAATYQVFANRSYVALHRARIRAALKHRRLFEQLGVGLMSVRRDVAIEIEASQSSFVDEAIVEHMRQQFIAADM